MTLLDANDTPLEAGQRFEVVTHSNPRIVGRRGIVTEVNRSNVTACLYAVIGPNPLNVPARFKPKDLRIVPNDDISQPHTRSWPNPAESVNPGKDKSKKIRKSVKAKRSRIWMTEEDYRVFENFLQYGDLANAQYVFVGMEEGLGGECLQTVVDSRYRWSRGEHDNMEAFKGNKVLQDAFYIQDMAEAAWDVTQETFGGNRQLFESRLDIKGVMSNQARMICLLRSNFDFLNLDKEQQRKATIDCFFNTLHKPNSGTAMFERYPLPKQGHFLYQVDSLPFNSYSSYLAYNNQPDNYRAGLIRELYDAYDLPMSIVYAGVHKEEFKLLPFYRDTLGFQFESYRTTQVNPITDRVEPSTGKGREFLIGTRRKSNGKLQHAVLTPFLGNGQISNQDVDVITTWIAAGMHAQANDMEV